MKLPIDKPGRLVLINKHRSWIGFQQPPVLLYSTYIHKAHTDISILHSIIYIPYIEIVVLIISINTNRCDFFSGNISLHVGKLIMNSRLR